MLELTVRVVVSLGIVLGLLWLVARVSSRRLAGGPRALVRVLGRSALGRNASVAVVEVGERVLVLGVSDGGVRLLTELDPEEVPGTSAPAPALAGSSVTDPPLAAAARSGAPLAGSVLAPATWRQAWAAATSRATTSRGGAGD